jgi:hypothetical protein
MGFGWKLTISFILLFLIGALCGVALTLVSGLLGASSSTTGFTNDSNK